MTKKLANMNESTNNVLINDQHEQRIDHLTGPKSSVTSSSLIYHKWLYEESEINSNIERTKSLKQIQPLLEETVQNKFTTSKMWESFQGLSLLVVWPSRKQPLITRLVIICRVTRCRAVVRLVRGIRPVCYGFVLFYSSFYTTVIELNRNSYSIFNILKVQVVLVAVLVMKASPRRLQLTISFAINLSQCLHYWFHRWKRSSSLSRRMLSNSGINSIWSRILSRRMYRMWCLFLILIRKFLIILVVGLIMGKLVELVVLRKKISSTIF